MRDRDRELIAAIRAQHRETFGTGRLRTRYKRCHEIAATALISGTAPRLTPSWSRASIGLSTASAGSTPGCSCRTAGYGTQ